MKDLSHESFTFILNKRFCKNNIYVSTCEKLTTTELNVLSHLKFRGSTIREVLSRYKIRMERRLPFVSYDEVYATIQYDSELKALLYPKMMYIETAVKNISLESILVKANSESIQDMYDKVVSSYTNAPANATSEEKKKLQQNKLNLQNSIQANLASAYRKNNPKITHFYNNVGYSDVPIWSLFEIMTMGDLGYLLSCLVYDVRDDISKRLGLNVSADTNRQLIYKYIYTLKDLRNAIAHNAGVFDG